jgi:allantoicase
MTARGASDFGAFENLVDLASRALGGMAVGASDDFFAEVARIIEPAEPHFDPERYTERGKWMDGWESRRKRGPGHDYCVIELGAPGSVRGFDIDTRFFVGNHPPFASIDGLRAPAGTPFSELAAAAWQPLLPEVRLRPGSRNLFAAEPLPFVSHVRLNVFPDGGVARLRVYGKVEPNERAPEHDEQSRVEVPSGLWDLGGLRNGGQVLACSDARFGAMNQLIFPGRARVMGEGWETRRGRPPDHRHDWIIVALARRGTLGVVEVDTHHYKGNFPERCSIEAADLAGASATELLRAADWRLLLPETPLSADTRHFFSSELVHRGPLSHVRLNIFPDGGVSRLRLWGAPHA